MMQMRSMLWMPACSLQAKRLTLNLSRRYLIRQTTPISYCPYHMSGCQKPSEARNISASYRERMQSGRCMCAKASELRVHVRATEE